MIMTSYIFHLFSFVSLIFFAVITVIDMVIFLSWRLIFLPFRWFGHIVVLHMSDIVFLIFVFLRCFWDIGGVGFQWLVFIFFDLFRLFHMTVHMTVLMGVSFHHQFLLFRHKLDASTRIFYHFGSFLPNHMISGFRFSNNVGFRFLILRWYIFFGCNWLNFMSVAVLYLWFVMDNFLVGNFLFYFLLLHVF